MNVPYVAAAHCSARGCPLQRALCRSCECRHIGLGSPASYLDIPAEAGSRRSRPYKRLAPGCRLHGHRTDKAEHAKIKARALHQAGLVEHGNLVVLCADEHVVG